MFAIIGRLTSAVSRIVGITQPIVRRMTTNAKSEIPEISKTRFETYNGLEERMMNYFSIRDKQRARRIVWGLAGASTVGLLSYGSVQLYLGKETAKVATIALQENNVKHEAMNLVKTIVTDNEVLNMFVGLLKTSLGQLAADPVVIQQLRDLFVTILKTPEIKEAVIILWGELRNDKEFISLCQGLVLDAISEKQIQDKVTQVFKEATNELLADPSVKESTKKAIEDIASDPTFRSMIGSNLWKAVRPW